MERRRFVLRTAEKEDAIDFSYILYNGKNEGEEDRLLQLELKITDLLALFFLSL